MKTNRNAADYMVLPVSGGAYRSMIDSALTHAFDTNAQHVLCGKVKAASMLDDETQATAIPTCPTCAARLAKLAAKAVAP